LHTHNFLTKNHTFLTNWPKQTFPLNFSSIRWNVCINNVYKSWPFIYSPFFHSRFTPFPFSLFFNPIWVAQHNNNQQRAIPQNPQQSLLQDLRAHHPKKPCLILAFEVKILIIITITTTSPATTNISCYHPHSSHNLFTHPSDLALDSNNWPSPLVKQHCFHPHYITAHQYLSKP
jgi:hypothetical protein